MSDVPVKALEFTRLPEATMRQRASTMLASLSARRSVRHFSTSPVPMDVVRDCIETAATAPSGANKQPWTFVLITDPAIKQQVREAAETEEAAFYGGRAGDRWLADLEPFATTADKPMLTQAPVLIAVMAQRYGSDKAQSHYYVQESVGIAVGFLLAALHNAGLATLTHTPSPMGFLRDILGRPFHEHAMLLMPVGYPAEDARVPDLKRKGVDEISEFFE